MDTLAKEQRSLLMSHVKGKNTEPEKIVRSLLHNSGFRFRLHRKDLPGSPDLVLLKYRTVIFVHGCFWHRHEGCKKATTPKDNFDFWQQKFRDNVARDRRNEEALSKLGWQVVTVWQCETIASRHEELKARLSIELQNALSK